MTDENLKDRIRALESELAGFKQREQALLHDVHKYRQLFELESDALFLIDSSSGRILEANQAAARMYGYSIKELLTLKNTDLSDEPKATRHATENQDLVVPIRYHKKKDKSIFPVEIVGSHFDYQGKRVHIAAIREISLRLETEERFRLTFASSPDAININRLSDGLYIDINQGFTELTGFTRDDVIGKTSMEIQIWHDPKDREKLVAALRQKGVYENLEARFKKKDGSLTTALMSARIFSLKGQPHIVSVTRDISDIIKAQKEKEVLKNQLVQAQRVEAIGRLAGGVAHDFNNILSGIFGYSQLAKANLGDVEKVDEYISHIFKGARRAADLVQQILTFSRQTEYEKQPIQIHLAIKETISLLRASMPSTIEIRTCIDSEQKVMADPTRIQQLIMNLGVNARDAMKEKGGMLSIDVTTIQMPETTDSLGQVILPGTYVELVVADTGCGMDPSVLVKVFEPYFTTKNSGDGTGIGLALVQAIVQEHQAFLTVDTNPGTGSQFCVYFPVCEEPLKDCKPEAQKDAQVGGNETIMLVDDEFSIRHSHEKILESHGYTVLSFENGVDALKACLQNSSPVDLIITDLTMPGMTGDLLAQNVLKTRPEMPIILCTGYSHALPESKAVALGIKKILNKPVDYRTLLAAIRTVLDADI